MEPIKEELEHTHRTVAYNSERFRLHDESPNVLHRRDIELATYRRPREVFLLPFALSADTWVSIGNDGSSKQTYRRCIFMTEPKYWGSDLWLTCRLRKSRASFRQPTNEKKCSSLAVREISSDAAQNCSQHSTERCDRKRSARYTRIIQPYLSSTWRQRSPL